MDLQQNPWLILLETLLPPGFGCLFPSRNLGSFQLLFQINFLPLTLSSPSGFLIMWRLLYLMVLLSSLGLFIYFFSLLFSLIAFPLPCPPGHWSIFLLPLVYYLFHLCIFNFNYGVLHLWFFVEGVIEVLHSFLEPSEYLYDHYFKFPLRPLL